MLLSLKSTSVTTRATKCAYVKRGGVRHSFVAFPNNPVVIMVKTSPENSSPKNNLVNSRTLPQIENVENTLFTLKQKPAFSGASWWQKKSIRWKAMALAIALGTLPTATLGLVAYWAADNSISKEITTVRKTLAVDLQNEVNLFMLERFKDIQIMANLDILTDPNLRDQISSVEKAATLERIQETYDIYNSIGIFDLKGDVIAQTGDQPLGNHLNRGYIQAALKTNSAVLSQPRISTSSGIYSVYAAAPIKDRVTGKTIAVIRTRIPVAVLEERLKDFTAEGDNFYLLDETGTIFLSSVGNYAIKTQSNNQTADYEAVNVEQVFSGISSQLDSDLPLTINSVKNQTNQTQQFIAFAPAKQLADLPSLNWQTLIATDTRIVFAPQRRLGQIYTFGTLAIAILVGAIAYYLANLATRPILTAAQTVEEIGEGNLKARIRVGGKDEISQLANNINLMAMQLEDFVQEQQLLARQTDVVKQTVIALNTALEKESLWDIAVTQAREGLGVDGVSYYSLEGDGQNQIVAESVIAEAVSQIGKDIYEPAFLEEYITQNLESEIVAINDIHGAELTIVEYASQISKLETIFYQKIAIAKVRQQGKLVGLLTAHHSSSDRPWQQSETDFLAQIANQVSVALDRLDFLQQQQDAQMREKQAKEDLQQRAFELLQQVDRISQGDLTIRAKVTEDEIGTIADSYNATIYSLQKLVTQVKNAADQVEETAGNNQTIIQQLATDAIDQAQSIALTMQQIQRMTKSINQVSQNASQAEYIVKQANETILAGDTAMNQAVNQINALQTTVSETEQKAKLLGESSQEISQVVNSIGRFAAQTHLLALKASIEAARAGEQGKGFATIADEVRSLANQSATATTDIENIVARIQLETNELVSAMAQGTEQVSLGTQLVKQTRQNLTQVTTASQEVSQLIAGIAQSAQGQSTISQEVSQLIAQVAVSAQTNSQSATQVSLKIEQLLTLANRLQTDIDQFKT